MSHGNPDLSFAALDPLLAQALALEEPQLTEFLDTLEHAERRAVVELLRQSRSDTYIGIVDAVNEAIARAAAAPDAAARSAGRWQLQHEIGSGGMGQVFYAERSEDSPAEQASNAGGYRQRAAVKVLWSHRVGSEFKERFYRERRILASIDHPGLARFLDGGLLEDGRPWFAMEYVDGVDIVSHAADLALDERLRLFLEVCDTVGYAHQRLILHRDIKPQNVLVDETGRPRLLDFGVARMLGDADEEALTRTQGTPLTLQYASPEQVTGKPIDVASDVYQLGLLLYELLAGRPPYELSQASLQEALRTICEQAPLPPSSHRGGIHRDLDAVVGHALDKLPAHRYASAAALAADVRRFLQGRPVVARAHSLWYVAAKFAQRHAVTVSIVTVSMLALASATVFSMQMARQAQAEAERSRKTQVILADVFQRADPFGEDGANVTLAEALIKAKPAIAAETAGDPRLAWEVHKTLANIYSSLGLLDMEKEAFETAWEAARQLGGDNEPEVLFAVAGIGNALTRANPQQALDFFAEHLPPAPGSETAAGDWLSAKYAQVSAWTRLRDDVRADEGARRMAEVARRFGVDEPRTLGRIHQLLAGASRRAGDVEAADGHWTSAVTYMREANQPFGHAVTLSNMALHYGMTQRYAEADAAFQQAVVVFRDAAPEDPTYANVLRLYAGLKFRMGQRDEALGTLDDALDILDRAEEGYEHFVALLTRANFTFVMGDVEPVLDAVVDGLEVAVSQFGVESEVTQRLFPILARLLMFADRPGAAAQLLGLEPPLPCDPQMAMKLATAAAAELADTPDLDAARQRMHSAIEDVRHAAGGRVAAFAEAVRAYRDDQHAFFDVLDRWRFLKELSDVAGQAGLTLPDDLAREARELEGRKRDAHALLNGPEGLAVRRWLDNLRGGQGAGPALICDAPGFAEGAAP